MRKLLNTLYITTETAYLSLDGENIVVLIEDKDKFRLPFVNIENIVTFSYVGVSPALMGKCCELGIGLTFLKPSGKYLARVEGAKKGNVKLRMSQYFYANDEAFCLSFAINIVTAKLFNSRYSLERTLRDSVQNTVKVSDASKYIKDNLPKCYEFDNLEALRGFEGIIAKYYFSAIDEMILEQKDVFRMNDRSRRPPLDNVNCMLSYLYTILSYEIVSALETVGLDPYVGFYHKVRVGRHSLALDIVEELRAYLVDRLVLTLINTKQVTKGDFLKKEGGAVLMTDDCRKKLLSAWQERKKDIIRHPFIDEKIEIGLIPYVQAQLLARYIRGDIEEYPPFLCK